jgi:hypothetical protein
MILKKSPANYAEDRSFFIHLSFVTILRHSKPWLPNPRKNQVHGKLNIKQMSFRNSLLILIAFFRISFMSWRETLKSTSLNGYTNRRVDKHDGGADDETNNILDTVGL